MNTTGFAPGQVTGLGSNTGTGLMAGTTGKYENSTLYFDVVFVSIF